MYDVVFEMYRDVVNGCTNRVRKIFPRECYTNLLQVVSELPELNYDNDLFCEVKVSWDRCVVEFSYHDTSCLKNKTKSTVEVVGC